MQCSYATESGKVVSILWAASYISERNCHCLLVRIRIVTIEAKIWRKEPSWYHSEGHKTHDCDLMDISRCNNYAKKKHCSLSSVSGTFFYSGFQDPTLLLIYTHE